MKNTVLTNLGLAFLRIVPTTMMLLAHGLPKFQKLIAGDFTFADPLKIGETPSLFLTVIGEFIAPILIIVGYKTKLSVVPAAITMVVASFVVHGADPYAKKELALLYLVFFIAIALLGPGKYSLDKK